MIPAAIVIDTVADPTDTRTATATRNAIWYNHRGHQAAGDVKPDAVVRSEAELIACLEKISTKE